MKQSINITDTLDENVRQYLSLCKSNCADKRMLEDAFLDIKELLINEIYFMKEIKRRISEEELSGFVLYVQDKFKSILENYNPEKGSFRHYFYTAMDYRAATYVKSKEKDEKLELTYILNYLPYEMAVSEPSPEYYLLSKEEENEKLNHYSIQAEKLRYLCAKNPLKQKRIFIFLCTQLPYLSHDIIDEICTVLNFNKHQTFEIARYLYCLVDDKKTKRNSYKYMQMRRDIYWRRSIEEESLLLRGMDSESVQKRLAYNKEKVNNPSSRSRTNKRKVSYPELSKILNIKESTIASAVYDSKKILKMANEANFTFKDSISEVNSFEPFKIFGIQADSLIDKQC